MTKEINEETERMEKETKRINEKTRSIREETERMREETKSINEKTRSINEETERIREETRRIREERYEVFSNKIQKYLKSINYIEDVETYWLDLGESLPKELIKRWNEKNRWKIYESYGGNTRYVITTDYVRNQSKIKK